MAEAMHPNDPPDCLHQHYSGIFSGASELPAFPAPAPSADFTEDEMLHAVSLRKTGKSVGGDGISLELIRALVEIPEGKSQLLAWFNGLLHLETSLVIGFEL